MGDEIIVYFRTRSKLNCWVLNVGEPIAELDGGRPFRCGMLAQALTAQGHRVVRWASTFRHYTKDFRANGFTIREYSDLLSFRLLPGPGYKLHRSPRRLMHHVVEARAFSEHAPQEEKPDVVLATIPTLALAKAVAHFGASAGCPVVLDVRDCWPDHYLVFLPAMLRGIARPLLYYQYRTLRRTLQAASGVTAVSNAYLEWAHVNGRVPDGRNDRVFPIGYEWPNADRVHQTFSPHFERKGLTREDFIVLFAGTFNTSFDLKTVLAAAERAHQRGMTKLKFALVGAGPYGKWVRETAARIPNVVTMDWIQNQQDLRNVLTSATVGLCPYREKGSISLPNKPFEFMAAGKPLLSSLTGELWNLIDRERIGANYKSSSPDSLLAAIGRMLDHPAEVAEMARRSRELFEAKFEASRIYPAFATFLEEIHLQSSGRKSPAITPAEPLANRG